MILLTTGAYHLTTCLACSLFLLLYDVHGPCWPLRGLLANVACLFQMCARQRRLVPPLSCPENPMNCHGLCHSSLIVPVVGSCWCWRYLSSMLRRRRCCRCYHPTISSGGKVSICSLSASGGRTLFRPMYQQQRQVRGTLWLLVWKSTLYSW